MRTPWMILTTADGWYVTEMFFQTEKELDERMAHLNKFGSEQDTEYITQKFHFTSKGWKEV